MVRTEKGNRQDGEISKKREFKGQVADFFKLEVVRSQMEVANVSWVVQPRGARKLDVGFVTKEGGKSDFGGLSLFGYEDCIGMVLARPEEYWEVRDGLGKNRHLTELMAQGAEVAVLTVDDFLAWGEFYQEVDKMGLLDRVGKKALDFSGLRRLSEKESEGLWGALETLWKENEDWFKSVGVEGFELNKGGWDVAFVGKDGGLVGVPICHLRTGQVENGVLVERVLSKLVCSPGLVVRRAGENKREAYERTKRMGTYYKGRRGDFEVTEGYEDLEVMPPMITDGQISLWQKLGFRGSLQSVLDGTRLTAEEVIRFLFLGESNVNPGELARMGFSLPSGGGEFPGIDVIFYKRGERGTRRVEAVDGFMGLDLQKRKLEKEGVLGLSNVKAITILPDNWSAKKMRDYTKIIRTDFNYRNLGPDGHILYLTRSLFGRWKAVGSAFLVENGDVDNFGSLRQRVEYGHGATNLERVELRMPRLKPQIGGVQMFVEEVGKGQRVRHGIDFGTAFTGVPESLMELTAREKTALGIRRSLETGELPMVSGLYYWRYLLQSAKEFHEMDYTGSENPVASFLRSELVAQVPFDEAVKYLGRGRARKIYRLGKEDVKEWYGDGEVETSNLIWTHGHIDHCGKAPFIRPETDFYGSAETMTIAGWLTSKGATWRDKPEYVSNILNYRPGRPYEREYRKLIPVYWNDQRIPLSDNLSFGLHLVNHSMGGATSVGVWERTGQPLMMYTGDLKMGNRTEEMMQAWAGEFPFLVVETTNMWGSFKPSIGLTEDDVKLTLEKIIGGKAARDIVVVVAPPNHMERLESILEVAASTGRQVAVGVKQAELIDRLRTAKGDVIPLQVDGFDNLYPEIGEEVALWWPPRTTSKSYQKELFRRASNGSLGILDGRRLSRQREKWIVVVDPFVKFIDEFGGVYIEGFTGVHATYYPYQDHAKGLLSVNQAWVRSLVEQGKRGRYAMDFRQSGARGRRIIMWPNYSVEGVNKPILHAGGHLTFEEMVVMLDVLLGRSHKGKRVLPIHGEYPERWARAMAKRIGSRYLKIIERVAPYDPGDPLNKPGFLTNLM
ncbi:hypothetical protein KJ953_04980 [Patescibacteria group bacterium]|nr:hypothetical protein [Patescibacteria group bacterium]MBU1256594.1 hypothetical protein [Patescibacteria group bacterium]MBU1457919.1 hypothetical protein [Patescibacteria group bacterium]